jgi:SPOR domain
MSEELIAADDQSHYEISLTAGQAFLAFVLLLLSLAASFAFGLMIGKGQADERLVVRKEPSVIQEGAAAPSKKVAEGRIVDLGVNNDDFKTAATDAKADVTPAAPDATATTAVAADEFTAPHGSVTSTPAPAAATVIETPKAAAPAPAAATPAPVAAAPSAAAPATPAFAQLLSTGDQKTAEAFAAKLINGGFTSAYVERGANDKGTIYRVRVRFGSESDARAAEPKLHEFSKDVWITK